MWKVSPVQMAVRKPKPNLAIGKCPVDQESGAHTTPQTEMGERIMCLIENNRLLAIL